MTDYREITSTEVEPRAPVTTALMSALRDNPISIANGDETVPNEARIKNSAFSILAPGDVEVLRASNEAFTNSVNTDTELFRMPFHQSGEVTFSFRYKTSGDAVEGRFRVRRIRAGSNTTLTTKTREKDSYATHTFDISVEVGDQITVTATVTDQPLNVTGSAFVNSVRVFTDGSELISFGQDLDNWVRL